MSELRMELQNQIKTIANYPKLDWIKVNGFEEVALIYEESLIWKAGQEYRPTLFRETSVSSRWIKAYAFSQKHNAQIKFKMKIKDRSDTGIKSTFQTSLDKLASIMTRLHNTNNINELPKSITRHIHTRG